MCMGNSEVPKSCHGVCVSVYMKRCGCGVRIKQKYFRKCIHCQKLERQLRKDKKKLQKELRAIRKPKPLSDPQDLLTRR